MGSLESSGEKTANMEASKRWNKSKRLDRSYSKAIGKGV